MDALKADYHQDSLDARDAATTQIQGIAELKTAQKRYERSATIGYERIADLQANVQDVRELTNDRSHQATLSEVSMKEVAEGISAFTNSVSRSSEEVMQKLHSISDRLEACPSMAMEQLTTLKSLVDMSNGMQLGTRAGCRDPPENTIEEALPAKNASSKDSRMTCDPEIYKILARIGHLADTTTAYRYSKDAQLLIEDVGRLLGLMKQHLSAESPSRDELPRKRKILCDFQYAQLETKLQLVEELAKTKRVLTASQWVRISNQGQYR